MADLRWALFVGALVTLLAGWIWPPALSAFGFALIGAAVLTHFLPVPWARKGWTYRFTLPYLAGLALIGGPVLAVVVDVALLLTQAFVKRRSLVWLLPNLVVSIFSGLLAGGAVMLFPGPWAGLVFGAVYLGANLALVQTLETRRGAVKMDAWVLPLTLLLTGGVVFWLGDLVGLGLSLLTVFLMREVARAHWRARRQDEETVVLLANLLQQAHPGTHRHLARVADLAEEVALRLGLRPAQAEQVRAAAILHDIGKIAVDEAVLDKPAKLTPEEYEHVKTHSEAGHEILGTGRFARVAEWVRSHHERPDGRGYPAGLSGEEIPLPSRIVSVVDAFDAMTGGIDGNDRRPYRPPMPIPEALQELDRCAGEQFDPAVVTAFRAALAKEVAA